MNQNEGESVNRSQMDVIGFLYVSLGSSTIQLHESLVSRRSCAYRLERILTMVYVVQSYWAYFGLYPSSCVWKTKNHNVSETGSVSVLRWMGAGQTYSAGPVRKS
jgi:hypothetical protein